MVRLKKKDIRKKKHNDKRKLQREIDRELLGNQNPEINDDGFKL